jgi:hypothetical protein
MYSLTCAVRWSAAADASELVDVDEGVWAMVPNTTMHEVMGVIAKVLGHFEAVSAAEMAASGPTTEDATKHDVAPHGETVLTELNFKQSIPRIAICSTTRQT